MTNQVSELPPGWSVVTLGELLASSANGFGRRLGGVGKPCVVIRLSDVHGGRIDLAAPRRICADAAETERYSLHENDILVIRVNGSADLVGRFIPCRGVDDQAIYCDHFIRLRLLEPHMSRYIEYFGNSAPARVYIDHNKVCSAGQNTVSQHTLNDLTIPLPPLAEQHRIADRIDELFTDLAAGVAALERVKRNLSRYRAAVLHAAVTGRLTETWRKKNGPPAEPGPQLLDRILTERRRQWEDRTRAKYKKNGSQPPKGWRERYPEPSLPKLPADGSPLPPPPLAEGWCWATLDQLAFVSSGTTPKRDVPAYWQNGSIPWIASTAVNAEFVDDPSDLVTDAALAATTLKLYEPGTLLVALYGEGKTRGKVTELRIHATVNQALAAICWFDGSREVKGYVKVALASMYHALRREAAGGVQPNLNVGLISATVVPLPSLAEQSAIVEAVNEKLSQIDALEAEVQRGLARAARLRQSILKAAFEGKLVAQDPSEESAGALLDRIRAESTPDNRVSRPPVARKARVSRN